MNPIKRVPLIVSGGDNEVIIEIMNIDDGELREIQDIRQGLSRRDEQVRTQNSLILQLRRELAEARADAERQITVARRMMARMNKTLSRLSHRPGVYSARLKRRRRRSTVQLPAVNRGSNANVNSNVIGNNAELNANSEEQQDTPIAVAQMGGGSVRTAAAPSVAVQADYSPTHRMDSFSSDEGGPPPPPLVARLCACPRMLHDLWRENEFGYPGCKPAKDFTIQERGKDRYEYYRRNVFWTVVGRMVLAG